MSTKHTPGLLHTSSDGTIIYDSNGWGVANATVFHGRHEPEGSRENARRIVACWNACDGIDIEKLEGKSIAEYVSNEAYFTGMNFADGGTDIGLKGLACQLLAASFAGQFKGAGAVNYLEVRMHHPELGSFVVNIQRQYGETPGQQLAAARAKSDELLADIRLLITKRMGAEQIREALQRAIAKAGGAA